jgi:hypothetical protein
MGVRGIADFLWRKHWQGPSLTTRITTECPSRCVRGQGDRTLLQVLSIRSENVLGFMGATGSARDMAAFERAAEKVPTVPSSVRLAAEDDVSGRYAKYVTYFLYRTTKDGRG